MASGEELRPSSSFPPYPEMILRAIEALNEVNGSNKSAISKHIESTYGEMPAGHSALLALHLNRMKDAGDLVFWKNNYTKPDPDAPPRRGRGRPPKPRDPTQPERDSGPARPRGRPPKDPDAPPKAKAEPSLSPSGRPRGRPRKMARPAGGLGGLEEGGPTGRPRGRPPKVKAQSQFTEVSVQ